MEVAVIEVTLTLSWPGNGNIGLETEGYTMKRQTSTQLRIRQMCSI